MSGAWQKRPASARAAKRPDVPTSAQPRPPALPAYAVPPSPSPRGGVVVQREIMKMERKLQKLEAAAAECKQVESANSLLESRLSAAKQTRKQNESKLRKQIAQRITAQNRFEAEITAVERAVENFVEPAPGPSKALGEHLASEIQNLLCTEQVKYKSAPSRCCRKCRGWCNCVSSAGPKQKSSSLSPSAAISLWPSLQDEGSFCWAVSELEAAKKACQVSSGSKALAVMPAAMPPAATAQQVASSLARTANDLNQATEKAEASVKEHETGLAHEEQRLHQQFCATRGGQDALYAALAIEILVMKEAIQKQSTLQDELDSIDPLLRSSDHWSTPTHVNTVIGAAGRLLQESFDIKNVAQATPSPWSAIIKHMKNGITDTRSQNNGLRSAMAAAQIAVDNDMRPDARIVQLERRLQRGLEATQHGVTKALEALQPVASSTTAMEACLSQTDNSAEELGNLSTCLLALFCGSTSKANTELAKFREDNATKADDQKCAITSTPKQKLAFQAWVNKESVEGLSQAALLAEAAAAAEKLRSEHEARMAHDAPRKLWLRQVASRMAKGREKPQMVRHDVKASEIQLQGPTTNAMNKTYKAADNSPKAVSNTEDGRRLSQSYCAALYSTLAEQAALTVPAAAPAQLPLRMADTPKRCSFNVTVISATNLRVADWSFGGGSSDPYCSCEIVDKGKSRFQTKHVSKSLNPTWNETYAIEDFEVGDALLFKIWDHDKVGKDDLLGSVELDGSFFMREGGFSQELLLQEHGATKKNKKGAGPATVTVKIEVAPGREDTLPTS